MNIIIPIKQVPDMDEVKFDKVEGRIDRSSADSEPNPFDLNALEEATRLKERFGGEITVLSMGPPGAEKTLRDGLARGADRGILLTDSEFAGADTWATSLTLSMAIKKIGDYDLILCGEKTVDGDTGQVGPEIAEILNIPHASYVSEILSINDKTIKIKSDSWGGTFIKKIYLPALLTVTKDLNEPRFPLLRKKLDARNVSIEKWDADSLPEVKKDDLGLQGSPTSVKEIEVPPEKEREGEIFRGSPENTVRNLIKKLVKNDLLKEGE